MSRKLAIMAYAAIAAALLPGTVLAQQQPTEPSWPQPMNTNPMLGYAILNQNEIRTGNGAATYRWDGAGWYGGNLSRVWFSSEGKLDTRTGTLDDTEVQTLYSRAISPFFDLQAGARYDFGNVPGQGWVVVGVEGLAPYFFELGAHAFVSSNGQLAARLDGSYDLFLTQRLILQPQIEVNFYSKQDTRRRTGSGLSDIDTGLRLRYEITRQIAPYIGVTYEGKYGGTADLARATGQRTDDVRLTIGIRLWI